jgi:DNA-binding SARP family transcriptional activator
MKDNLWRISLFGGLCAVRGETVVTHFETRKAAALLALLALNVGRPTPRELLADQLWPEEDVLTVRGRFRQALSTVRCILEPPGTPSGSVLVADRTDVRLNPAAVTVDVEAFESELRMALSANEAEACALLRQAVDRYVGELLPGYYEEPILIARDRLAEANQSALCRLARILLTSGELEDGLVYARRAVAANPLREDAQLALMQLYAASGRAAEALQQFRAFERILHEELDTAPSADLQAAAATIRAETDRLPRTRPAPEVELTPAPQREPEPMAGSRSGSGPRADPQPETEPVGGAVPLESPFYVVRETDRQFAQAIARRDSIVLVKGAWQMGKTSLLARAMEQARGSGCRVVLSDLQKLTASQLATADMLFFTLAETIADQLDLDVTPESRWTPGRGWNVNFERFLRRDVLLKLDVPLIWGLDEVDRLFGLPFSTEVFGLFRSWHNERSLDPSGPWSRLTLVISYATDAHLFITDLNHSPFNVGTRLSLEDFQRGEVAELNRRYGKPIKSEAELDRFVGLVGGHPYLVRRGLHVLAIRKLDMDRFEIEALRDDGIYGDHLRRMLSALRQDPALFSALRALLHDHVIPDAESFYRLRTAGVVDGPIRESARVRCPLYRTYLESRTE